MIATLMQTLRRYSAQTLYGPQNAAVLRYLDAARRCAKQLAAERLTITRVELGTSSDYGRSRVRPVIEIETPPAGVQHPDRCIRFRRRTVDGVVEILNAALIEDCVVQWLEPANGMPAPDHKTAAPATSPAPPSEK